MLSKNVLQMWSLLNNVNDYMSGECHEIWLKLLQAGSTWTWKVQRARKQSVILVASVKQQACNLQATTLRDSQAYCAIWRNSWILQVCLSCNCFEKKNELCIIQVWSINVLHAHCNKLHHRVWNDEPCNIFFPLTAWTLSMVTWCCNGMMSLHYWGPWVGEFG
jgi:hypothetical protein